MRSIRLCGRVMISNPLAKAICFRKVPSVKKRRGRLLEDQLFQGLLNSNSNANGHADHGGAMGAPPVAGGATRASGSGR